MGVFNRNNGRKTGLPVVVRTTHVQQNDEHKPLSNGSVTDETVSSQLRNRYLTDKTVFNRLPYRYYNGCKPLGKPFPLIMSALLNQQSQPPWRQPFGKINGRISWTISGGSWHQYNPFIDNKITSSLNSISIHLLTENGRLSRRGACTDINR